MTRVPSLSRRIGAGGLRYGSDGATTAPRFMARWAIRAAAMWRKSAASGQVAAKARRMGRCRILEGCGAGTL
jgi:hypothetical protein